MFNLFRGKKTANEKELEEYIKKSNASIDYTCGDGTRFSMKIDDVFSILGRGIVVVGTISSGEIALNDEILICDLNMNVKCTATIMGIEIFRKVINKAKSGDNVGLLLKNITRETISKGDILIK